MGDFACSGRSGEIGAQIAKDRFGFTPVDRHRIGAQSAGDHSELAIIFILFAAGHVGADVAQIGCQKAGRFRNMDPGERAGIGSGVCRAVGQGAADLGVNAVDAVDRGHRILPMAEGRHGDETRGPAQPTMHVRAEVRMIEHTL